MIKNNPRFFASVIGAQWGDEGKGKIIDFLTFKDFTFVCRFSGGDNAGHTIVVKDKKYKFSILPSGALHKDKKLAIGSGCLLNLDLLAKEWQNAKKINPELQLFISEKAHLIMPYHIAIDEAEEMRRADKIGTTKRGIGPCMMDKVGRFGFRIGELKNEERILKRLKEILGTKNRLFTNYYGMKSYDAERVLSGLRASFAVLRPHVVNLQEIFEKFPNENVIFEGAQGTLLDPNFGSYPFVTSTPTTFSAIVLGNEEEVNFRSENFQNWGVFKAYSTRVGAGPFFSKMDDKNCEKIARLGFEIGTVSQRDRIIGWFDAVLARFAQKVNGFNRLALTCLDALSGFEKIRVCVGYKIQNKEFKRFQPLAEEGDVEPIFCDLPGWKEDIGMAKNFAELPSNCQKYVLFLEKEIGCKFNLFSVGPARRQTFFR